MDTKTYEQLRPLADAIKELKQQHYCGTQDAYEYLKERRKYFELCSELNKRLKPEFPKARLPTASEVEDLESHINTFLWDFFSVDIYNDIEGWKDETSNSPKVENAVDEWLKKNFTRFASEYYRTLLACENPEHYTKQAAFISLCERFLGELPSELKESARDKAEGLEEDLKKYEAERVHENFNMHMLYRRMKNDRILNRDEYQREFLASYLEGLRTTYFLKPMNFLNYFENSDSSFPKAFEELVASESGVLNSCRKTYAESKKPDDLLTAEAFEYLLRSLHRHRSFVEKMLKEYNSEE